jgi:hypothetical protein
MTPNPRRAARALAIAVAAAALTVTGVAGTASAATKSEPAASWWKGNTWKEFVAECSNQGGESANYGDEMVCYTKYGKITCKVSGGRTTQCTDTRATEMPAPKPTTKRSAQEFDVRRR